MKKTFKLNNLGCANCAAKIETAISKIDGVSEVRVNFMMSKLTLEANDENFSRILEASQKICKKYESDCQIIGI